VLTLIKLKQALRFQLLQQGDWEGGGQNKKSKSWVHQSSSENKGIWRWTKAGHTCQMSTQVLSTDNNASHLT